MSEFIDFEMAKKLKNQKEKEAETGTFEAAYERFREECGGSFQDTETEGKELEVNWFDEYEGDADEKS